MNGTVCGNICLHHMIMENGTGGYALLDAMR